MLVPRQNAPVCPCKPRDTEVSSLRAKFSGLLQAPDFAIKHDYPAHGEYTGAV